ncbi:MAG TPA: hypothetical protein VMR76_02915 [Candidatus Saccharimonadia bacterium]|nr:hypothetical protein [Candidatus Saccharimonadia bacterium]
MSKQNSVGVVVPASLADAMTTWKLTTQSVKLAKKLEEEERLKANAYVTPGGPTEYVFYL